MTRDITRFMRAGLEVSNTSKTFMRALSGNAVFEDKNGSSASDAVYSYKGPVSDENDQL